MTSKTYHSLDKLVIDLESPTLKIRSGLFRDIEPSVFDKINYPSQSGRIRNIIKGVYTDLYYQIQNKSATA